MKRNVLVKCPVCNEDLVVTKLECKHCNTKIEGEFNLSKFNYLEESQLNFALIFIKNAGNIKAIEKELNISYPTVKKNLDDLIQALGFNKVDIVEEELVYHNKKDVLNALKDGKLTYNEAKKVLKELGE